MNHLVSICRFGIRSFLVSQSGASGTEFAVHPLRNSCDPSRFHRDMVDRIVPLPDLDKYVTIRFDRSP